MSDTLLRVECRVVRVWALCPRCGEKMEVRTMQPTNPPRYGHACPKCLYRQSYGQPSPWIEYEPIEQENV